MGNFVSARFFFLNLTKCCRVFYSLKYRGFKLKFSIILGLLFLVSIGLQDTHFQNHSPPFKIKLVASNYCEDSFILITNFIYI